MTGSDEPQQPQMGHNPFGMDMGDLFNFGGFGRQGGGAGGQQRGQRRTYTFSFGGAGAGAGGRRPGSGFRF